MTIGRFPCRPSRPAVFIDKDGTLVLNRPYNVDPRHIELTAGAGPAAARLSQLGFLLIVVTNQSGIGEGRFAEEALLPVRRRIDELLEPHGVKLDGFYYCPHQPGVAGLPLCCCRKPMPGMLMRAAVEKQIDLSRSWLIGDILDDVQAGRAAGASTILLINGGETEWRLDSARLPHYAAADLAEACSVIEFQTGSPIRLSETAERRRYGTSRL